MLSNSYNEYTEKLYQQFNINTIKAARSVAAKSESRAEIKEIVVTNY